jgi:glyoxylase-like metal-dependent hydrolase (beta-lactamase superfamily II)
VLIRAVAARPGITWILLTPYAMTGWNAPYALSNRAGHAVHEESTNLSHVTEESPGILRVDLGWRGIPGQIASYLLMEPDALAVVEPGPGSTLPTLLRAIESLGRHPREITHVLVTHVHLDHAGSAGALARLAPRASVHVHPLGAAHLADPARLLASAARIYGDRMDELWGGMEPVPGDRLRVLEDRDPLRIGRRTLHAVDTPGHARHHHAFHDPDSGVLFGGDVTGIRLHGARYVRPPTPPPELEVERWLESLARIRALRPSLLLPTHFGGSAEVDWHLDELQDRLVRWIGWARQRLDAGDDLAALSSALQQLAYAEAAEACGAGTAAAYEEAVPSPMLAAGIHRYLTRR